MDYAERISAKCIEVMKQREAADWSWEMKANIPLFESIMDAIQPFRFIMTELLLSSFNFGYVSWSRRWQNTMHHASPHSLSLLGYLVD